MPRRFEHAVGLVDLPVPYCNSLVCSELQNERRYETGSDLGPKNGSHVLQSLDVIENDTGHLSDVR